jgi:hypothetical protein
VVVRGVVTIQVTVGGCSVHRITVEMSQGAAQAFDFQANQDLSAARELELLVYQDGGAMQIVDKSLTGGGITQPTATTFRATFTNAEAAALPAGGHWCEVWATLSSGDRKQLGSGPFRVFDTKGYDA